MGAEVSVKQQPISSSLFTGRDIFLSSLEEFFTNQGCKARLRREYLLFCMGGAGKTQISLKFAEIHQSRFVNPQYIEVNTLNLE